MVVYTKHRVYMVIIALAGTRRLFSYDSLTRIEEQEWSKGIYSYSHQECDTRGMLKKQGFTSWSEDRVYVGG